MNNIGNTIRKTSNVVAWFGITDFEDADSQLRLETAKC